MIALIGACGSNESTSGAGGTDAETPLWNPPPLQWVECGTNLTCATLIVPRDYDRADSGTFELPVKRYRSPSQSDRIGTLLVNPGGPGSGGTFLAESADVNYSAELLERFDVVGWDPRGTGGSSPFIDCIDDLDVYFALDPSPDTQAEREALLDGAREFTDSCRRRNTEILPYLSTNSSARDIDSLRRALGENTISYLGFSYGSELGATWATFYPSTVRAAVFDAAVDPHLGYSDALVAQARSFEEVLGRFFRSCDEEQCDFMKPGESASVAFDRIAAQIESDPLPTYEGRVEAGPGVFQTAVALAMYGEGWWSSLASALLAADEGDGGPLLDLYDQYFGQHFDGRTIGNDIEAYFAITCLEREEGLSVPTVMKMGRDIDRTAPRLGAGWVQEMLICANWVAPADPRTTISEGAGNKVLVVGSSGDAATPLTGTRAMAEAFGNAYLVVVDSDQHTSYGGNDCATKIIDRFLFGSNPKLVESNC